jgi:hypothetical protein
MRSIYGFLDILAISSPLPLLLSLDLLETEREIERERERKIPINAWILWIKYSFDTSLLSSRGRCLSYTSCSTPPS